jgi:nitroreductase
VTGLHPWRRIDLRYAEGDMLGPVSWEFFEGGEATLVRYVYRGVTPNSDYTRESFASGRSLRLHTEAMQTDAFANMRRLLEQPHQLDGGDLFTAMHTLRAVRRFRPDPVPESALRQIIEAATRAASARNTQPWKFLAVRSAAKKAEVGRLYDDAWRQAQAYTEQTDADADIRERPDYDRMMRDVNDLAERLHEVPVLILACLDTQQLGPLADSSGRILSPQSAYASIFPAVQNLMLAARGLGLGTTLTTVFAAAEPQLRGVLGIPDHVHIAALVPLGYPLTPFRVTKRKAVSEVAFVDEWGKKLERE